MAELKEQKYMLEIAKVQGIGKAAENLFISQPALSKFLARTEEMYGIQLFERVGKKMIPTYAGEQYLGCVQKEFTFFKPKFVVDFNGWSVQGNVWEWDYEIQDQTGRAVALVNKEVFSLADTYVMEIDRPENALYVLMLVLAIDAEKCSSQS